MEEKMIITDTAEHATNPVQPASRPKSRGLFFDADGNLHTNNLSAYWIPEVTTTEVIHGTTYIVTGTFTGKDSLVPKLERILVRNIMNENNPDDTTDNETDQEKED